MFSVIEVIKSLIIYGVVGSQIAAIILLLALLFNRQGAVVRFAGRYALVLSFLLTLASVGSSLFYSYIVGFEPCLLCWWQRIFLFPQLVIFALALWKKRADAFLYAVALSILGAATAVYQILLPWLEEYGIVCVSDGGVSCTKLYVYELGYITIPVMSLTAFVLLILLAISNKVYARQ